MKFAMWNGKLSTRYVTGLRSVLVLNHYDGFSIRSLIQTFYSCFYSLLLISYCNPGKRT